MGEHRCDCDIVPTFIVVPYLERLTNQLYPIPLVSSIALNTGIVHDRNAMRNFLIVGGPEPARVR